MPRSGIPATGRAPATVHRWFGVIAPLLLATTTATAQYRARRYDVEKPQPLLPIMRLEMGGAPVWATCAGTDLGCGRLNSVGGGARLQGFFPVSEAVALGPRIVHARFGGTPSSSHVTTVELGVQVHSGFDAAAGGYFGLSAASIHSPGDAPVCPKKPTAGLGAEIGFHARAHGRWGLTVFAAAVGRGWGGSSCEIPSYLSAEPQSDGPAAIGGFGMVGLALSYDVGEYRL